MTTENDDDEPEATLHLGDASWHDGPGWYYVDVEYPDDGSCGAFATSRDARDHAEAAGYQVVPASEPEKEEPLRELLADIMAMGRELQESRAKLAAIAIDATRYRRLRILGAAPFDTRDLERGTVMRFSTLDDYVDADIAAMPSRGEALQ